MGDSDSGFGYRPPLAGGYGYQPKFRILDQRLTLDPEIERMMRELEAKMTARQFIQQFLKPDFSLMLSQWSSLIGTPANPYLTPPPAPNGGGYKPGAGPATPRPGELSDVTSALYKTPVVQRIVEQAHDEGMRQLRLLRNEWSNAPVGDRVVMVTMTTIVVGSAVTAVVANQPSREAAFHLIKDKKIPIPKVDGLSFTIMDRGAGVTVPLGVPGLSGSAHYNVSAGQLPDYGVTVNFDVMEFIKKKK
jgi:hypothetical protein